MSTRNIYLKTMPPADAVTKAKAVLNRERLIKKEIIPVSEASGRVTAAPVYARYSAPSFHAAAMDGIAVWAKKTYFAREGYPVRLEPETDFFPVNTGEPIPPGMDTVIKIEETIGTSSGAIFIESPHFPWAHVRRVGQDIVASELLLTCNHLLSPYDIGALLAAGVWEIEVWERVKLVFIPTGSEVLDFALRPSPGLGQIVESNSQIFCALARSWGALPNNVSPVPDNPEMLREAVQQALTSDAQVVVVGAGSSAGETDYTARVFAELGEVLVRGLAISPGKPTLLGVAAGKLLVGAPGYPGSAVACFEEVLAPLVAWLGRSISVERERLNVKLTRNIPSPLGTEEMVRLAVGRIAGEALAVPLGRGSGMITNLAKAQALLRVTAASEGVDQGDTMEAELLVPRSVLDQVLLHVGSHDILLDLLANELMSLNQPVRLVSSNVGSLAGLAAIRDCSAMFAGSHLLDPGTEDFNFPALAKYLPGIDVYVINLAIRHQGLIVPKGNPKRLQQIEDLAREEVTFINRQRGAGTRILLDYHLQKAGIDPSNIRGYQHEEFTHMAVAVNVLSGAVDTGLGISSAARALDLDFVPLARERYDIVIPRIFLNDPRIQSLLSLLQQSELKSKIESFGGYETTLTGREMAPGMGLDG
ncbi:MAG: molybdopterin biosynthesis protein [Desulfuromonadales bacterium]|nr:molybdopterin biosynthesis protein [Desulfuromonadales bacterium]